MKVVINRCYGGFGLSHEAIMKYAHLAKINLVPKPTKYSTIPYEYYIDGIEENFWSEYNIARDDPTLVKIVEQMGESAGTMYAELKVVEVPDNVKWHICEYDGIEHIAEDHRTWR